MPGSFLLYGVLQLLAFIGYVLIYRLPTLRKVYWSEQLPGPWALPILGNALQIVNKTLADFFDLGNEWTAQYGNVYRLWFGDKLVIHLTHPVDAEVIMNSTRYINKSEMYDFLHKWLFEGLLTSKAKKWKARRRIITPAFHFKVLEQYVETFDRQSETMMALLLQHSPQQPINMHEKAVLYTLDVICEAAMGITLNAQNNEDGKYAKAVEELSFRINNQILSPFLRNRFLYLLSPTRRRINKCLDIVHGFTDDLIVQRRAILDSRASPTSPEDYMPSDAADDSEHIGYKDCKYNFIDILLHARIDGQPLTNRDIREEVDTFIFEGHDTTATAINFCLFNIAKYPECQRRCVAEIRAVLGTDRKRPMTMSLLNSLPYMDLVIKESLRIYPSVPLVGRYVEQEVTFNGHTYPADSHVVINLYALQHNPTVFPDPEQFRPERFTQEQVYQGKAKNFAYIPFSAGSRNCIGQKFAELELKSILTKVLRYFEIALHPDSVPAPRMYVGMILKPWVPILFQLTERQAL